jgi:hypothetical protein
VTHDAAVKVLHTRRFSRNEVAVPSLKVVTDEAPAARPRRRPATVKAAAETGTRRDLLVALRARIAADIDNANTPPRDLAALSRRLLEIARDIEALDAADKADDIGDAAATPDEEWAPARGRPARPATRNRQ